MSAERPKTDAAIARYALVSGLITPAEYKRVMWAENRWLIYLSVPGNPNAAEAINLTDRREERREAHA